MSHSSEFSLLARWVLDHGEDLLAYLVRRLKCREEAADLSQETYLRLHASAPVESPEHLHARAFHIAAHLAIDHQRKQARHARWLAEQPRAVPLASSPESILVGRQRLQALKAALETLPVHYRTAFILNRVHGHSHAEVARHMRIAPRTVAKYLAQALRHCRHLADDAR